MQHTRDPRPAQQVQEHYDIEKDLARRLRAAGKEERRALYASLYDELFRRVPHHSQLTRKKSAQESTRIVDSQMQLLRRFVGGGVTFLEIGPGDCALSFHVAGHAKKVFAVDVSDEITRAAATPVNFQLSLSDGCSIPVPLGSVDVAYSNQLMEHLHPDDALEQLKNVFQALAPGGKYICITPSRLNGPHDISRWFDMEATGFHLKEYTVGELARMFRSIGFSRVQVVIGSQDRLLFLPPFAVIVFERILALFPIKMRRKLAMTRLFRALLGIRIIGIK